jgi:hypothetical protein
MFLLLQVMFVTILMFLSLVSAVSYNSDVLLMEVMFLTIVSDVLKCK